MKVLLEEHFKPHLEFTLRDPLLYGDYKNALDESEPRLYEDIQDFEAAKALFQEVGIVHPARGRVIFVRNLGCILAK